MQPKGRGLEWKPRELFFYTLYMSTPFEVIFKLNSEHVYFECLSLLSSAPVMF